MGFLLNVFLFISFLIVVDERHQYRWTSSLCELVGCPYSIFQNIFIPFFIPFIRSFVWRVSASHIVTFIPNTRCRTNVILCTISVFRCKCWKHLYMVSFRFFSICLCLLSFLCFLQLLIIVCISFHLMMSRKCLISNFKNSFFLKINKKCKRKSHFIFHHCL